MITVDTSVISALMRTESDELLLAWLEEQPADSVWISRITLFGTTLGWAMLPASSRRRSLEAAFAAVLEDDLNNRVLDFDGPAARSAALLAAAGQPAGRPMDLPDAQVAGIALSRRASLATRNAKHFSGPDTPVVSPWDPHA